LGGLAGSGFLSRSPGRGTFVSFKALELDEPLHCRFERDDESGYIPVFTKLLSRGRRTAPSPFNELLGGSASEFVCVERLIEISSEFTVHSLLLFPYPRYSALLEIPVDIFNTLNIKKLLFQELGVSVRRINQRLRIGQIAPAVAGLIGVEQGSTGLLMRTAGFSEEETVIYGQELSIPTTERWLVVNSMSQV
jgi:DNA-binding GntR family transcriptional regulator